MRITLMLLAVVFMSRVAVSAPSLDPNDVFGNYMGQAQYTDYFYGVPDKTKPPVLLSVSFPTSILTIGGNTYVGDISVIGSYFFFRGSPGGEPNVILTARLLPKGKPGKIKLSGVASLARGPVGCIADVKISVKQVPE